MSLLRTKSVNVGAVLAFMGNPADEPETFIVGPAEFSLGAGDVVKVVDLDRSREAETPYARVTVAVLKGKCCGRVGVVTMDMSLRSQRGWRPLTQTGSIEPVRVLKGGMKDGKVT